MSKEIFTKESLIEKLKEIRKMGWIESGRHGNCGGVKFITALEHGHILVDFDARTRHNHGTKFRLRRNKFPELYENIEII